MQTSIATGRVHRVRGADDLGRMHAGQVLVCDAIEPTMPHVLPLAERVPSDSMLPPAGPRPGYRILTGRR